MKRVSNLYPKLISEQNLTIAIKTVINSHKWVHYPDKPNKTSLWLETTIDDRVKELKTIIENGYVPSPVTMKRRYDRNARKWRDICEPRMWPDQCVHHALVQVIEPICMRGMDKWCCGSIRGRGAHYGVKAIKKWIKKDPSGTRYCLEADIKHFYDSLTPEQVMWRMKQLIKDHRTLDLIGIVIQDGVRIGFFTSQWFANTFLQPLDHAIREQFKAAHYIRYMDNFTIFSNRKRTIRKILYFMMQWLGEHDLELKTNWQIFRTKERLPNALGYRFGNGYTLVRKHNLLAIKRQVKMFYYRRERGMTVSVKFAQGLLSRLGTLRHCNCHLIYQRIMKKHTQRKLKDIVRKYMKGVTATWQMYLEQQRYLAVSA